MLVHPQALSSRFPTPELWGGLLALALLAGGCSSGGNTYSLDEGALADRFLPSTRTVGYHPDSLGALTVRTEEDSTIDMELEGDYAALWYRWSASYRTLGAGPSRRRPLSYATFWSLELSLAALQPEMGIQGLSGGQAREALARRRTEYREAIQIDVFWFEWEGGSALAGPGAQVELVVDGERYRPSKEDYGPLREAFLSGGRTALYRRNTFHFRRVVDGTDLLAGATSVDLLVQQISGAQGRVRFRWQWGEAASARTGRVFTGNVLAVVPPAR